MGIIFDIIKDPNCIFLFEVEWLEIALSRTTPDLDSMDKVHE